MICNLLKCLNNLNGAESIKCLTSRHIVAVLGSIGEPMKSKLVNLSVVVALAISGFAVCVTEARAESPVVECARLQKSVKKHTHAIKRRLAKKMKVSSVMKKQLKMARKSYAVSCETQSVCGNVQPALCEAAGADFCIQVIKQHTYASINEMISQGGRFLYLGECSNEGDIYGAPEAVQ